MTTDTKAVARYVPTSSHGGMVKCLGWGEGTYVSDADHERVVGELQAHFDECRQVGNDMIEQHESEITRLRASLAESRAEVEGLKKDAERWNWIMEGHYGNEPTRANRVIGACWSRKAMEDAIDNDIATQAAMEKGNV